MVLIIENDARFVHASLEKAAKHENNERCKAINRYGLRVGFHPHTVEVTGSNPVPPNFTFINSKYLRLHPLCSNFRR